MKKILLNAFFAVSLISFPQLHGAEAWAEKLGSDDPAVWQKAETDLRAEGAGAKDILTQLAKHSDPWIVARAERLLMALRGIDPRLSRNNQLAILGFNELNETSRAELLSTLSRPGPGHLGAIIYLYEKSEGAANASEARNWQQQLRSAISSNPSEVESLNPAAISPATLGFMLSCISDKPQGANAQRYSKWRDANPDIRFHLLNNHVEFEISRLRENGGTLALLAYLPDIKDASARAHAARLVRGLVLADKALALDTLDEKACIGHLIVLSSSGYGAMGAMEWYGKHLARHTGMADALPPELTNLTIRHLVIQKKLAEAIRLLLASQPDGFSLSNRTDWDLVREIGSSLGSDPAGLPEGLPAINDTSQLPVMGHMLNEWYTRSAPSETTPAPNGKIECFDRWAKTDEWLQAAQWHGALNLYQQLMIRRGKFTEMLILHESDQNQQALMNLGQIIIAQPELIPQVPAGKCSVKTLRFMLHGALSSYSSTWRDSKPKPSFELAEAWLKTHPTLLDKDSFTTQPLYQAALDWKAGRRVEAASLLLATNQPLITEYGGQTHSNPNPIGSHAIAMLADLLASAPDADLKTLLPAETTTKETLITILNRFSRRKDQTPAEIRMSLALSALIRERFDPDGTDFAINSYEARRIALDAWMSGDDKLAGDILITSFFSNPDKDEQYDGGAAWALALLGRVDEAMEKLDSAKTSMPAPVYASKRARLLQVLGRNKEAMETVSPEHQPILRLNLALDTGDWAAAASAATAAYSENRVYGAIRSCIDTLSGDPELLKRTANANLGNIKLLHGDSLLDDDLKEMARDAELAAKCERILAAALASGTTVPYMQVMDYFQYPDLLPDKSRAIQLGTEIATKDSIIINGEPVAGVHKIIIAASLLNLGRGDLAYTAIRPLFAKSLETKPATSLKRSYGWGYTPMLYEAFNGILRVIQLEWPDLPAEKQMEKLDATLAHREPVIRAKNMLDLIGKHHEKLTKNELHAALWLPLFDLSHSGEVTEDLKTKALEMMDAHQPNENDRKRLANACTPEIWFMESHHPPGGTGMQYEFGYNPKAGNKDKPRQKDFVLMDGLAAARKLIGKGEQEKAAQLIRECVMRNLLDPELTDQRVNWTTKEGGGYGSGRSLISGGSSTLVVFFESYDIPAEIGLPLIRACTDTWNNTSDDIRFLNAANYLSANGKLTEAIGMYRRFLVVTSGVSGTGIAGRPHVVRFCQARGLLAAQEKNGSAAVQDIRRLVQLAPYTPANAAGIIKSLKDNSDQESLDAAREVIDQFWRVRLIEIPTSRTYTHWQKQWAALFP